MKTFWMFAASLAALVTTALALRHWRRRTARQVIEAYDFPPFLRQRVREHHPGLDDAALADIERGLRQFFLACAMADRRHVAMPSKAVDALWHEFILHTRAYQAFCRRAFGRLLHHVPAEAMPEHGRKAEGLRRAWYWSCREEGIDPRRPDRLPVLFALDAALAIPGGYRYVPDCTRLGRDRGDTHCASGMGCGSSCGSGCGGDGGGDGGGCGGGD